MADIWFETGSETGSELQPPHFMFKWSETDPEDFTLQVQENLLSEG